MEKCQYCDKECKNKLGLSAHIKFKHPAIKDSAVKDPIVEDPIVKDLQFEAERRKRIAKLRKEADDCNVVKLY